MSTAPTTRRVLVALGAVLAVLIGATGFWRWRLSRGSEGAGPVFPPRTCGPELGAAAESGALVGEETLPEAKAALARTLGALPASVSAALARFQVRFAVVTEAQLPKPCLELIRIAPANAAAAALSDAQVRVCVSDDRAYIGLAPAQVASAAAAASALAIPVAIHVYLTGLFEPSMPTGPLPAGERRLAAVWGAVTRQLAQALSDESQGRGDYAPLLSAAAVGAASPLRAALGAFADSYYCNADTREALRRRYPKSVALFVTSIQPILGPAAASRRP